MNRARPFSKIHMLARPAFLETAWWLGLTAYIALLIWLRLPLLTAYGQEFDEGLFLMTARMVLAGHPLYEAIFTDAEPGLTLILASAFRWLGDSLLVGRAVIAMLMALCLIGVTLCGRALYGRWGAWLTLFILSTSPEFVQESTLVLRDVPAVGFTFLALAAALYYNRRPHLWLAGLAGGFISVSLLFKFLSPFILLLLAILLALPHSRVEDAERGSEVEDPGSEAYRAYRTGRYDIKRIIQSWIVFGLAGLLPLGAVLVWVDPRLLFEQTILFRLASRTAYPSNTPPNNLYLMWRYLSPFRLWLPLAVFGALRVTWRRKGLTWVPLAVLILTIMLLAWQAPLHIHAMIALLPPLALLATYGLLEFVKLLQSWPLNRLDQQINAGLGMMMVIVGGLGLVRGEWPGPKLTPFVPDNPPSEAIKLIQQAVPPGGTVVTDDQMTVFYAGRRSHPWLVNTSIMRLKSASVTVDELISLTDAMGEQVVWASTRFPPAYKAWLGDNYWLHWSQDGLNTLYLGRKWPLIENNVEDPVRVAIFEGGIRLVRAEVGLVQSLPNDWLQIDTVWSADQPLANNYTIFIQLLNAQGQLVAQMDRPPLLGLFPTSQWPALTAHGIGDRFFVPLPEDLPAGNYRLIIGLYHSETLERLTVLETYRENLGDAVVVAEGIHWPIEKTP